MDVSAAFSSDEFSWAVVREARKTLGVYLPPESFEPNERWNAYMRYVPGFSSLDIQTAYAIYIKTTSAASKGSDQPQGGSVEIISDYGNLVMSPQDGRIYLSPKSYGDPFKLHALGVVLSHAAGWDVQNGVVFDEPTKDIPYADLAAGVVDNIAEASASQPTIVPMTMTDVPFDVPTTQPATISVVPTNMGADVQEKRDVSADEVVGKRKEIVPPIVAWPPEAEEGPSSIILSAAGEPRGLCRDQGPDETDELDALCQQMKAQQPVAEPYASSIQKMFGFAKRLVCSIRQNAASIAVGFAVSASIRIGAQLAFAESLATNYSTAMTLAFSVGVGALAGGVSKLAVTALYGGEKKKEKNWHYKAFVQGMGWGLGGGVLGAGFAEWLASHDLSGLFGQQIVEPSHAQVPVDSAATGAEAATVAAASVDPAEAVKSVLTEDQFNKLPRAIQKLAFSNKPEDLVSFGKEASEKLFNGAGRAGRKAAARLTECTLSYAEATGVHNHTVEKLHANLAYMAAHGKGMIKDKALAILHAHQAGEVMNHFGARLLRLLGAPAPG